jgi:hypothetical protein
MDAEVANTQNFWPLYGLIASRYIVLGLFAFSEWRKRRRSRQDSGETYNSPPDDINQVPDQPTHNNKYQI